MLNQKPTDDLGDLDINERIILKLKEKQYVEVVD
jgi:hypothetical protein